jgi:hypothetical protein
LILVLLITTAVTVTSCTSSRASANHGCKNTQGMIGYK